VQICHAFVDVPYEFPEQKEGFRRREAEHLLSAGRRALSGLNRNL